jgi:hypothetical protein
MSMHQARQGGQARLLWHGTPKGFAYCECGEDLQGSFPLAGRALSNLVPLLANARPALLVGTLVHRTLDDLAIGHELLDMRNERAVASFAACSSRLALDSVERLVIITIPRRRVTRSSITSHTPSGASVIRRMKKQKESRGKSAR